MDVTLTAFAIHVFSRDVNMGSRFSNELLKVGVFLAAAGSLLFATGCTFIGTSTNGAIAFHTAVLLGDVPEIAATQHFQLDIYSRDVANSGEGMECIVANVRKGNSAEQLRYLVVKTAGESRWRIFRLDDRPSLPTTKPATTQN